MSVIPAERKQRRSCGADVYWLRHARTGKMAPIDAAPDPAGNIIVHLDQGTYENIPKDEREAQRDWLRTSHFQTCPSAEFWKKRGDLRDTEVRP